MDTHIYPGYAIPPDYDSMLLKLIVHGRDRREAVCKMRSALGELIVEGVDTNRDFQYEVISHPAFREARADTLFISDHFPQYCGQRENL